MIPVTVAAWSNDDLAVNGSRSVVQQITKLRTIGNHNRGTMVELGDMDRAVAC
jgi:hypothetical protein